MPYITREDGERFIIPSYRDVLSAKKQSLLRKEVLLLATNYGDYVTLQRKNIEQYEVAFSADPGYLLGETIWHYFKRPRNLIYCEAIPNTADVILVIVKGGSVYLDGSFPLDSIPEELVIFKTQQISFDIYIYGDVPISQRPEPGKFVFDTDSLKSFTVLEQPIFPTLPLNRAYQLQPVDVVLKTQGIGTFPIKKVMVGIVLLGLLWMGWTYVTTHRQELPQMVVGVVNPYQAYMNALTSADPAVEVSRVANNVSLLYSIPGWIPDHIDYSAGEVNAMVLSLGSRSNVLFHWAKMNHAAVDITPSGFFIKLTIPLLNRLPPTTISQLDNVIAILIDKLSYVIPGNNLKLGSYVNKGKYTEAQMTITFNNISTLTLGLIGEQFKMLPLTLEKISIKNEKGYISGTIVIKALGN
jgi:hypothetical protein